MKHFLSKKLFSVLLLSFCLVVLGGITIVYGQTNLTIDKDIILGTGRKITFPDGSNITSATAIGGGGWTASTTKIYPQAATFVGIGTTNPTSPLYVVGTTTIAGVLQVGAGGGIGEAATSTVIYRSQFIDSDNVSYYLDPANTGTSAVFAGNVGIGTATPVARLAIAGNGTGIARIGDPGFGSGNYTGVSFNGTLNTTSYNILSSPTDQNLYINRPSGSHILFRMANADQFAITSSGYVGVGTASPAAPLNLYATPTAGFVEQLRIGGTGNYRSLDLGTYGSYGGYMSTYGNDMYILSGRGVSSENHSIHFYTGFNGTNGQAENNERMTIYYNGNVGIGTAAPSYKLHVAGVIYADDGNVNTADIVGNKIDGVTFDPVYTIEGNRYATYNPGMVGGVKEELSDVATLVAISNEGLYSHTIDLNNKEKGSDEWLFAHTVDVERNGLKNVAVLLTPNFDGKVWYEKNEQDKKITIYGVSNSNNSSLEVSYRLTAPRFDAKDWTNYSSSEWEGLNFDTYYKKAN